MLMRNYTPIIWEKQPFCGPKPDKDREKYSGVLFDL
jgi:hypothetical protein